MAKPADIPVEDQKNPASTAVALVQLETQVERSQFFAHTALNENYLRLGELEIFLHGLVDTLLAKGLVVEDELIAAMQKVRSELAQRNEIHGARTMVRVDPCGVEPSPPVLVDCSTRLHICHAACCKLDFALTVPEIESGKAKWDLGRPYFIRHDQHGACVHLDSGGCRIYNDRPGACRGYSCANDPRIWKDFEKMELNQEWIDKNLSRTAEPFLVTALMHSPNQLSEPETPKKTATPEVQQ
jgi:Fe-S-cluster containining protein